MKPLLHLLVPVALAGLITAWGAGNACGAEACGDDPRLARLGELLRKGATPEAPFTVTPESFIRLQPSVRKALGPALVVCPGVPLNAAGKPLMRLKLPFPDIWEAMEMAVNAGDWDEVAFLRNSVAPQPLPAEALFSLLEVPVWSRESMKKLASALSIAPAIDGWRFFALDVFQALGGKAEAPARIGWAGNAESLAGARAKAAALKRQEVFVPYSGQFSKEAAQSLARCGVEAVPAEKFF